MFNPGAILLIVAVALRALFWYSQGQSFNLVIAIFGLYALLFIGILLLELRLGKNQKWLLQGSQAFYLALQAGLVMKLLTLPPLNDFCGLLFVPLSIQAVRFYRRRVGVIWITGFTLSMALILVRGGAKFPGGLFMALLFGGTCFLAGNYSHLIQTAGEARRDNQRTLTELQTVHSQLQNDTQQRQELAAEKERHRLARELHDSVTQNIFSMNLTAQSTRLLLKKDPGRVDPMLEQMQRLAHSVMDEIQMVAIQFHASPDVVEDLETAIQRLLADQHGYKGLLVHLEAGAAKSLPAATVEGLYHIIQEALTNAAKHSGVHEATIRLHLAAEPSWIEIEDHGIGFDPQTANNQRGHIGLVTMTEGANEIGWKLSLKSQAGCGTCIRVEEDLPGGNDGQST